MNCKNFRDLLYLFQDDELGAAERDACQEHVNACDACSRLLLAEGVMLRAVKAKLTRAPAPPGLEARIRAALRVQAGAGARLPWYRAPWFAAAAAAGLLLAVLVPTLVGGLEVAPHGPAVPVHAEVVVVDRDCDRAGHGLDAQRRCAHPLHINALKTADGAYWTISPDQTDYRYLLLDRAVRGTTLVIDGELYEDAMIIRLREVEQKAERTRRIPRDSNPVRARAAGARAHAGSPGTGRRGA